MNNPGSANKIIGYLVLIILFTFITFSPVLDADFANWDDDENVVYREEIRGFSRKTIPWIFTNFTVGDFKPVTWLSYILDHAFWGLNPFGYHLGNLILHAGSSCLLFLLFIRLGNLSDNERSAAFLLASFYAVLFFALHPLRVESVAWVSERKGVLCVFFYLAAVLAYSRYAERGKALWYILTLILSGIALLSKPLAVPLPLILLLLDVYPLGRTGMGWGRLIREKIPFFIASAAVAAMAFIGQAQGEALISLQTLGIADRLLRTCRNIAFYLCKTIVPLRLAPVYPDTEPALDPTIVIILIFGALLCLTAIGISFWRKGRKWPLTWWVWFLINIFPASGFFRTGLTGTADRFVYLASVGISGLVLCGLLGLFRTGRRTITAICAGVILVAFASLSYRQARLWNNSERLWSAAVGKYPDATVARAHYGQLLFERGADEEAVTQLRRALLLLQAKPLLAGDIQFSVRTNLAQSLSRLGQLEEAAAILEEILKSQDTWLAHHCLGGIYRRLQRPEQAALEYEEVLRQRPDWVPALCDYGLIIAQSGKPREAMELYLRALGYMPGSPRARYNLALAFLDLGESDRAVSILRELADEFPDNSLVFRALTVAYSVSGKNEEATRMIQAREGKGSQSALELPYSTGGKPGVLYPLRQ
ncbi:MAG: tetratricopeptide repeat protein [Candidatus Erginobacter occultus]|nr:tetratricopeptide repeat protein [Candidatus Erginobacter occultus]